MKKLLPLLLCLLVFTNCGDSKEKKDANSNSSNTEKKNTLGKKIVVITSNDAMQYNLKEIKAKAGQKVKLIFKHVGKLDKKIMGHNIVILKKGTNVAEFAAKAATAAKTDYIPEGTTSIIAHTKMIGGGETTKIEFTAPEAGVYDFICTFPAHYALMKGQFIVE